MNFLGNIGIRNSEICFIRTPNLSTPRFGFTSSPQFQRSEKINSQSLSLLNQRSGKYIFNIFKFIPKLFTITTNNSSCKFNIEMLKEASSIIDKHLLDNPQELTFHIDIKDEENVLSKFESLFEGEVVVFDEDELPISQKITKALNLIKCPNFMKPESLKSNTESLSYGNNKNILSVELDRNHFQIFLHKPTLQKFVIKTNKKEYKCNKFGVYSSVVIRHLLDENRELNEFQYDFDDEFDEFQSICNLFNFETVKMTKNNMEILRMMAEDLQINEILEIVNKYIDDSEKVSKKIDDQQMIIDQIDELFDLLYHIQEKTVETVKNSIIESNWSKGIEKVQELAAFILQIIKSDFLMHDSILELLIQLDKEANDMNNLSVLLPSVVSQLLYSSMKLPMTQWMLMNSQQRFDANKNEFRIGESRIMSNYAFIYKLYKKEIIKKDELNYYLAKIDLKNCGLYEPLIIWFLPEIYQNNPNLLTTILLSKQFTSDKMTNQLIDRSKVRSFYLQYLPDKIDLYSKLRDLGEPIDELTKVLRKDDVDTFQSFISKIEVSQINNCYIPFNLFENYASNGSINYINYAAAYGSIKCFKYLLLNHGKIDTLTFKYAVYGGNVEIIKIVDQLINDESSSEKLTMIRGGRTRYRGGFGVTAAFGNKRMYSLEDERIVPAIIKHRNDLFDWILEEKLGEKQETLYPFLFSAVENGNAHSFIEIVEKGCELDTDQLSALIQIASTNGFYMLVRLLLDFMSERYKSIEFKVYRFTVIFGNLSILKLFVKDMNNNNLSSVLSSAIERDHISIIHYFFETLVGKEFQITSDSISEPIKQSLNKKKNDIFNYLIEKVQLNNPDIFKNNEIISRLFISACEYKNFEASKKIADLIFDYNPEKDFTSLFISAAKAGNVELCKYFIDKKATINYEKISANVSELGSINEELFSFIGSVSEDAKNRILGCIDEAIANKNKGLVEFLLKNNAPCSYALFEAVETNDIEMVDIVLKYKNKPSFINKKSLRGTALLIAVSKNNLPIVKRLLSLPGIDASLYCTRNETPFIKAINDLNIEMVDQFISFYGENILKQKWQIDTIINDILKFNKNENSDQQTKKKSAILTRLLEARCIDINYHFYYYTLLTYACKANDIDFVKYLLQYDEIDVNSYEPANGNTPLIIAVQNNNFDIVKLLIEHPKTDINLMNYYEQTALTIAVITQCNDIIDLLINDEKFDPEESRLDYAFFISNGETFKKLLSAEALDVNYKSARKIRNKKNLNYFNNLPPIKDSTMSFIFKATKKYGTALTNAVEENNIEMVDLIIKHPSFDKTKSLFNVAVAKAVYSNNIEIMKKLLEFNNNDLNITDIDGNDLLYYAVINLNQEVLIELLTNYDSKQFDILKAFIGSYSKSNINYDWNLVIDENTFSLKDRFEIRNEEEEEVAENNDVPEKSPVDIMTILYDFDLEHDHLIDFSKLLPNGNSFFTIINHRNSFINEVVHFLLEKGVDPNLPDKFNVYPLEYAIRNNSDEFVTELLNSNEIDYSKKILFKKNEFFFGSPIFMNDPKVNDVYYMSYLHLAACSSVQILQDFLSRNAIDVNITDDMGQTPLMLACKYCRKENVRRLFQVDNLDFLHRNNEGKNALDIAKTRRYRVTGKTNNEIDNDDDSEEINDKNIFMDRLFSYL